jgi:broad-specificity NMP kinase
MSGAPGFGKSTMANPLAQSIDEVIINHRIIGSWALTESTDNNVDFPFV